MVFAWLLLLLLLLCVHVQVHLLLPERTQAGRCTQLLSFNACVAVHDLSQPAVTSQTPF